MASKFERISALSLETTQHLIETPESWMRFLRSAAWLYKYSFPDQVLISAQRPDATACASLELWNTVFNRWVLDKKYWIIKSDFDVWLNGKKEE